MKPVIHTVEEDSDIHDPNSRWLAYCEEPRVASYGATEAKARADCLKGIEEAPTDCNNEDCFCMPKCEWIGGKLLEVLCRWTGLDPKEFEQERELDN